MKRKLCCLFLCLSLLLLCCSLPVAAYDGEAPDIGRILPIAVVIGFMLSLITCVVVMNGMKMTGIKKSATEYITEDGVDYRIRRDVFTHKTRTVVKMPKNDNK